MSDFDDEIYTISDDSSLESHPYVAKKPFFASLKWNRKTLIIGGSAVIVIGIAVIGFLFWQQATGNTINPIVLYPRHPITPTPIASGQVAASPTPSQSSNPIQRIMSSVASLFSQPQQVPNRKANYTAYAPGTTIPAQKHTPELSHYVGLGISNGQSQSSGSSQNNQSSGSQLPVATPTPVNNDIQLVFKDPDGTIEVYDPPATPPADIAWARYINKQDRYAIDYPANWQMIKTAYNGHEGISLYQPNVVLNQDTPFIGFGWAIYYLLPQGTNITTAYSSPISVDDVPGTLYTQGALGYSYIAAVFQYANGFWGLGTSVSDPLFAYVYSHMINSLVFNQ